MTQIQYLTFDSIHEGVGASQVLAYVKKLSRNWKIELINFEKDIETDETSDYRSRNEFAWLKLPFGRTGFLGGILRVLMLSKKVNKRSIVHARGDFAAFAAILKGAHKVIWDCRALNADQRINSKRKKKISLEYLILRLIEYICAKRAKHIIVITQRAKILLSERYNLPDAKFTVISTCVDLASFKSLKNEKVGERFLNVAFVGTLGPQYDIDLMNKLVEEFRKQVPTKFTIALSRGATSLYGKLNYDVKVNLTHAEMPEFIAGQDVGLSVWREDMGVSLASVAATKNAEFLACGKPIIVNRSQGDIGDIVKENRVGIVTRGDTSYEILKYVTQFLTLLSKDSELPSRCRGVAENYYSLNEAVDRISDIYERLCTVHS